MKRMLLMLPVFGILGLALWWMVVGWEAGADAPMEATDYIPMVLGVVFTLILGCGLMALLFFSSRRGYDEAASGVLDPQAAAPPERTGSYNLHVRPSASSPEGMAHRHADAETPATSQRAIR
ncbi:hypothetical protein [Roseixanthobacter glucoisosaccharinicivorans]|uniref:hypothetical protein n=1 Tax=Roseixanthobacter glucoisosaccharinicivorans TaxID=3119923 RepID=UPI003728171B